MKHRTSLWTLVPILIPSVRSPSARFVALQVLVLAVRTWLSIVVAKLDGQIARSIIRGRRSRLLICLGYWAALAVPAACTNSLIKLLKTRIALEFRTNLTRHVHRLYVRDAVLFRVNKGSALPNSPQEHPGSDSQIAASKPKPPLRPSVSPDQCITEEMANFGEAAALAISSVGKPSVDYCVFMYQLWRKLGTQCVCGILASYAVTACILSAAAPPFGKLAAVGANLEGQYRSAHSKVSLNAEQIALYCGSRSEKSTLWRLYTQLHTSLHHKLKSETVHSVLEDVLLKYTWSALGYVFVALPLYQAPLSTLSASRILEHFVTTRRLMLGLGNAGSSLMYSLKDVAKLNGLAFRVNGFLAVLGQESKDLNPATRADQIALNASICTPQRTLVKELSFSVPAGRHMLVTGPNGAGKSSLVRVLAEIWPTYSHKELTVPASTLFLSQTPYLCDPASLLQQIVYPHESSTCTQAELQQILNTVRLGYLPSREGGWHVVRPWSKVLSGGEKQRLMFARVLYHRPRFAILDESTSAVSADVESILYRELQARQITLVTLSHRDILLKHHAAELQLGLGPDRTGWSFQRVGSKGRLISIAEEIAALNARLSRENVCRSRLAEVEQLLFARPE